MCLDLSTNVFPPVFDLFKAIFCQVYYPCQNQPFFSIPNSFMSNLSLPPSASTPFPSCVLTHPVLRYGWLIYGSHSVEPSLLEINGVLFLPDSLLSLVLIFFDLSGAQDTDTEDDFIHPCNIHLLMLHYEPFTLMALHPV